MRKTGSMLALTATLCLLVNCGGGSGDNFNVEEQVKGCLGDGAGFVLAVTAAFGALQDAIANDNDLGSGITIVPHPSIDQAWNFHFPIDADQNGETDSAIDGTITFVGTDPTQEPVGDGDSAVVSFQASGVEGLSGNGTFTVLFTDVGPVSVWGEATMTLPDGCGVTVTIDQQAPLAYGSLRFATADVFGSEVVGTLRVQASVRGHDIDCTLTLSEASNVISATGVEIDGVEVGDFDFTLPLDGLSLSLLSYCSLTHAQGVFLFGGDIVNALLDEVINDAGNPNVTIVPTGPTTFTFTISNAEGGTITGSVVVTGLVEANSTVSAAISWEWRSGDGVSYVRTRNGSPMVLTAAVDEGGLVTGGSMYGTFDCLFGEEFFVRLNQVQEGPTCQASLTISEQSAITFEGALNQIDATGGMGTLVGTFNGNTLRIQVAAVGGNLQPIASFVNGIPIPNGLLLSTVR